MAPERVGLVEPGRVRVRAGRAGAVEWNGRPALRLEDGLALVEDVQAADASVEVELGAEGACCAGVALRVRGEARRFECVFVRPHASGGPDAVQYDPVFGGVHTWQLYAGPGYQAPADVPCGRWVALRVDVAGKRMAVSIDGRRCLVVPRLAHPPEPGAVGVWCEGGACFSEVRLGGVDPARLKPLASDDAGGVPPGTVRWWWIRGAGPARAEENGVLNLNRYLPPAPGSEVLLYRDFWVARPGTLALAFAFGDELELLVDAVRVFEGRHVRTDELSRAGRGYVEPGSHTARTPVRPGRHVLVARLRALEPLGWGLAVRLTGEDGAELVLQGD